MAGINAVLDEQAEYEQLYYLHDARVVRFCRLLLTDPHEVGDVSMEVRQESIWPLTPGRRPPNRNLSMPAHKPAQETMHAFEAFHGVLLPVVVDIVLIPGYERRESCNNM